MGVSLCAGAWFEVGLFTLTCSTVDVLCVAVAVGMSVISDGKVVNNVVTLNKQRRLCVLPCLS